MSEMKPLHSNVQDPAELDGIIPSIIPSHIDARSPQPRSIFSDNVTRLGKHRIDKEEYSNFHDVRTIHHRRTSSSQLLEDLIARPIDPLFEDATLTKSNISPTRRTLTQIIAFILCVALGIASVQAIRNLQGQSRERVRAELAQQVSAVSNESKKLQEDITKQRSELSRLTKQTANNKVIHDINNTNIITAQSAVTGPGVEVILTNPKDASAADTSGRVTDGQRPANVTDAQIQYVVNVLLASGAEAVSINGQRLGPQTSIRAAGETILIGVVGIQSPYSIQAIGDKNTLRAGLKNRVNAINLFQSTRIGYSVHISNDLKLPAASTVKNNYAKREEK